MKRKNIILQKHLVRNVKGKNLHYKRITVKGHSDTRNSSSSFLMHMVFKKENFELKFISFICRLVQQWAKHSLSRFDCYCDVIQMACYFAI